MSWSEMWTWKAETPGQRAGRRPDLGRELGQRGEVVAEQRARAGEAIAGQLHAVAGVAGEADDDPVELVRCACGACRSTVSDTWAHPPVTVRRAVATDRADVDLTAPIAVYGTAPDASAADQVIEAS